MAKDYIAKKIQDAPRVISLLSSDLAKKARQDGTDIIPLAGAPYDLPPEHVLDAARRAVGEDCRPHPSGLLELREAIAKKLLEENQIRADPEEEILVTNGAMQALYVVMLAILEPGDEVLTPSPAFFFDGLVELAGGRSVYAPLLEEERFRFDIERIEHGVSRRTKVLMVNSPANPTGHVATRDELAAIADLADRRDLIVVSDESFEKFVYDGREHHSIASFPGMSARTITVHSFTKSYSMPTWRMGYLAARPEMVRHFQKVLEWLVLSCNHVVQKAATAALLGETAWIDKIVREFEDNRNLFHRGLEEMAGISCVRPEGGPLLFPNVSQLGMDGEAFSDRILRDCGIRSEPGYAFQSPNHVRLHFGGRRKWVEEAVRRLRQTVDRIHG